MPKILRIINRFNIGGPTYNAAYLTKFLSDDFETLLVGGQKDETEDSSEFILNSLGLEPMIIEEMKREVDLKQDRIAYKKIKELIGDYKPDIVHTHASKAGAIGRLAAHKMKVPQIYHTFHGHVFHSYFGKAKTAVYKNIERNLAKKSTRIIAISDIQKHELSTIHKICSPDKITVVPLGFDLERFHTDIEEKRARFRQEWKIKDNEIAIGIVGRLVPIKNHKMFLEAAKMVTDQTNKTVKFVIVGDGELRNELEEYVGELGLNNVVFTSWQKDVDIVNAGLDIIALTSKNEGTPVSLIEAQASQKPIVSTSVGGIENIVIPNETALLSPSEDVTAFSRNLLQLVENKSMRDAFASGGSHVLSNFHYKRLCADFEKIYLNDYKDTL
ncbi:glycosyltransferase [Parvicella tangerina]|uniref:D-inositol-3-phosphate glycosyltransferase n=1 Tax=Parvicella tangerina TaxID=2829795 RepID=A0A916JJQ2_9FLAO|nr:glycosyltransferase [Parvicella tangerina]CAG5078153.1 D-inositol-3-phosphate glycosyltransferase [Parvicella tangerina]